MTGQQRSEPGDQSCQEFVELLTGYLDGAVPPELREAIDEHLAGCEGCSNVLAQLRTVVDVLGELTEADVEGIDPVDRDRIVATFRRLRRR